MKGIILTGGSGTRLYPLTKAVSKQILPVYDKPMIYYPLSTLMLANIREILIISTPRDIEVFKELLGDGSQLGLRLEYAIQAEPRGLAEAFIIGESFIGKDRVALVLGDNIFYGRHFSNVLKKAVEQEGATIFGYYVRDPREYGVVTFDKEGKVLTLEEITSINNHYLREGRLNVKILGRGFAWLDTGSHDSLMEASEYVASIQKRQGLYVSCIEEIAYVKGFIDKMQLLALAEEFYKTEYGKYLQRLAEEDATVARG